MNEERAGFRMRGNALKECQGVADTIRLLRCQRGRRDEWIYRTRNGGREESQTPSRCRTYITSCRSTATDPNECQRRTARSTTFSRLRLSSMSAFSRVVDESNSVIQPAIRSGETGVSLAGLFAPAACCRPEVELELFDA